MYYALRKLKCPSCGSYIRENTGKVLKFKCNTRLRLEGWNKGSLQRTTQCIRKTTQAEQNLARQVREKVLCETKIGDSQVFVWLQPEN